MVSYEGALRISKRYFAGEELSDKVKEAYYYLRQCHNFEKVQGMMLNLPELIGSKVYVRAWRKAGDLLGDLPSVETLGAIRDAHTGNVVSFDSVEELIADLEIG